RGTLAAVLQDSVLSVRFEAARGMAVLRHSSGLEVLVEALQDGYLRYRALRALAELGDPRALEAVRKVFSKFFLSSFERTLAAGVMVKLGDAKGAAHLLNRTHKRWTLDRALATELMGELKISGAFERLSVLLGDKYPEIRGASARGL